MLIQNPKNSHVRTYSLYRASVTMRSLEILTQRIFNNLIKENQKLESDSVLKQSTIVSSVQSPGSKVQRLLCRVQCPESNVQSPGSRIQHQESSVQGPASRVQRPDSSVQSPAFRIQRPDSSIQSPASKPCVQSPGILVCPFLSITFQYLPFVIFIWSNYQFIEKVQRQLLKIVSQVIWIFINPNKSSSLNLESYQFNQ